MNDHLTSFVITKTSKIVFLLSVAVALYWVLGWTINVYSNAFVGTVFEITWLPVIAMTIILPVVSLVLLVKEKFNFRSLYLYSILIIAFTMSVMRIILT